MGKGFINKKLAQMLLDVDWTYYGFFGTPA
jgi:hypothetical protein